MHVTIHRSTKLGYRRFRSARPRYSWPAAARHLHRGSVRSGPVLSPLGATAMMHMRRGRRLPCSGAGVSAMLLLVAFLVVLRASPSLSSAAAARASDTVAVGRPLVGRQRLVSKRGKFALGFFQPDSSSEKWYVGIWYNRISQHTTVWVANRGSPVADPASSQLAVSGDGNMVLLAGGSRSPVWSTNVDFAGIGIGSTARSTVGVILDTGNLVLADASNSSVVLWQSFDHFGDTWLPGGKLGRNKRTGEVTRLFAWRGVGDPAPGLFSLELDPAGGTSQYLLSWNGSRQYWSSGEWTGHAFAAVPEMTASDSYPMSLYKFGYVDGEDESYFVYDVKDDSLVTRFLMDVTGQIKFLTWLESAGEWMLFWSEPKAKCDVYSLCGAFGVCTEAEVACACLRGFRERRPEEWRRGDHAGGCARGTPLLRCDRGDTAAAAVSTQKATSDGFYSMPNVKLPVNGVGVAAPSARDCEVACLGNCSCAAYSFFNGGCSLWHGELINLQDTSSTGAGDGGIMIRLAASELSSGSTGHTKQLMVTYLTAGLVAAVGAVVLLVSLFVLRRRRRRRVKATRRALEGSLMAFTYRDMQSVTKNFSEKLGGGAFGSVFKGSLADTSTAALVAVKKLEGVGQGEKQFRAEVSTIGTIQHVNLVRLLGFCSEGRRRLLVYEHMANASLDRHLFPPSSSGGGCGHGGGVLSWETRYQIALGVARGLDYLHEKCRDCIVHCDVKPENILLDGAFVAKVADFGLAKLIGRDFSRALTTMRGTVGYLAPEWIAGTAITAKADVFSYGMMMFELVSGRRNVEHREDGTVDFFPSTAVRRLLDGEGLETAVDGRLAGHADMGQVERACKVACWCVQDAESARPTMATVVRALEGLIHVGTPPVPRSLKVLGDPANSVERFSGLPSI